MDFGVGSGDATVRFWPKPPTKLPDFRGLMVCAYHDVTAVFLITLISSVRSLIHWWEVSVIHPSRMMQPN